MESFKTQQNLAFPGMQRINPDPSTGFCVNTSTEISGSESGGDSEEVWMMVEELRRVERRGMLESLVEAVRTVEARGKW